LLQHAYNPVDWYEWGEEAFQKAQAENKPILLSIGYSSCYWCHVMERETFENEEIARLMNDSVISIKIDREQHPDLDEIYMAATQLITGSGGWPNNVFVTPDLKPFFAGTYFPPKDSLERVGFATVIKRISQIWRENPQIVKQQAEQLSQQIRIIKQKEEIIGDDSLPNVQVIDSLFDYLRKNHDQEFGGFYQAPKFPHENMLFFLVNFYRLKNDNEALEIIRTTLSKMA